MIDFDRVEGRSTDFVLKHVRASQRVFRQGDRGGRIHVFAAYQSCLGLKENFLPPIRDSIVRPQRQPIQKDDNLRSDARTT